MSISSHTRQSPSSPALQTAALFFFLYFYSCVIECLVISILLLLFKPPTSPSTASEPYLSPSLRLSAILVFLCPGLTAAFRSHRRTCR
ncbi:hypothetical protein J3F84DRAFT_219723 [Trichoderma pleuroticola]